MNILVPRDDLGIFLYRGYERARDRAGDKQSAPDLWNNIAKRLCVEAPRIFRGFVMEERQLLIRHANDYDNIGRFLYRFSREARGLPTGLWRRESAATREFWANVAKRFVGAIFFHVVD